MSRLSIGAACLLLCAALMSSMVSAAAPDEQRVFIRYAYQLNNDKGVRALKEPYAILSASNVIFERCATEWVLLDEQREYLEKKFDKVSRDYLQAYIAAYTTRVGGNMPPSQEMVDLMAEEIMNQQKQAVDQIAQAIQKPGCHGSKVRTNLVKLEEMRQADLKPKPAPVIPKLKD